MEKIGIAIIGFGRAGQIHYKNIINNFNCEIKYIVDPILKTHELVNSDILIIKDLDICLKDTYVKLVVVTSPTNTHYDIIKKSLQHKTELPSQFKTSWLLGRKHGSFLFKFSDLIFMSLLLRMFSESALSPR